MLDFTLGELTAFILGFSIVFPSFMAWRDQYRKVKELERLKGIIKTDLY